MAAQGRSSYSVVCLLACAATAGAQDHQREQQQARDWRLEVVRVHARFQGRPGTFAQFGDSITETLAFWAPLRHTRKNASPRMERAYRIVADRLRPECWAEWKGPEFGNQGGRSVAWADEHVVAWLERLNPEVAVVMFGTNDLPNLGADEYRDKLRSVVRKCLARGTVVILSTIPPRHGFAAKSAEFAEAARKVARELSVPLVDYHAEVLKRRPNDWDGAADDFKSFEGHDVPTLLSRDGVHPSAPRLYQNDYSDRALRSNGYALRNYLVLMKYAEVIEALLDSRMNSGYHLARMPFEIVFAPEAIGDLRRLSARDRANVRDALEIHLRHEPTKVSRSRIKRLRGLSRPQYRLRVDELRVFYDLMGDEVHVLAIVSKSDAEAWLAEEGEADEDSSAFGSEG